MKSQARTVDTVLVKSREMAGRSQTLGKWGKDDRKQNTLVFSPVGKVTQPCFFFKWPLVAPAACMLQVRTWTESTTLYFWRNQIPTQKS
jgi:hypothetical protein